VLLRQVGAVLEHHQVAQLGAERKKVGQGLQPLFVAGAQVGLARVVANNRRTCALVISKPSSSSPPSPRVAGVA